MVPNDSYISLFQPLHNLNWGKLYVQVAVCKKVLKVDVRETGGKVSRTADAWMRLGQQMPECAYRTRRPHFIELHEGRCL